MAEITYKLLTALETLAEAKPDDIIWINSGGKSYQIKVSNFYKLLTDQLVNNIIFKNKSGEFDAEATPFVNANGIVLKAKSKPLDLGQNQILQATNIRFNNPGTHKKITTETENQLIEFLSNAGINISAPDGKTITLSYNGAVVQTFSASGLDVKGKITNLTKGTTDTDAVNLLQLNEKLNTAINNNNKNELTIPETTYTFSVLKNDSKKEGYGYQNKINYSGVTPDKVIQLQDGVDIGFVHRKINNTQGYIIFGEKIIKQLFPSAQPDEIPTIPSALLNLALGKSNQVAPSGAIWNLEGLAIKAGQDANNPNITTWVTSEGEETEDKSKAANAKYSGGRCYLYSGKAMLRRGTLKLTGVSAEQAELLSAQNDEPLVENFEPTLTENEGSGEVIFSSDSSSNYWVIEVTAGGGTFNVFKNFQVFQTNTSIESTGFYYALYSSVALGLRIQSLDKRIEVLEKEALLAFPAQNVFINELKVG